MDNYQPHPYFERPSFAELLHEETIAKPMREHPVAEQLDEAVARARAILAEPEGIDAPLSAIEERLGYNSGPEVLVAGCVRASGHAVLVPKGGTR